MRRLVLALVGLSLAFACSGSTSPTPQPAPVQPSAPPPTSSSVPLLWPLAGSQGRDWMINNYVDSDPSGAVADYTGASGSSAKTINGHLGVDIDVPNFRWMDGNLSIIRAAAGGVVTAVRDTEFDRNTSCASPVANLVTVRHADGLTAIYGHLKKGSAAVSLGQQVSAGDALGVVGSSGCSTAPHLHFELRDGTNNVVDPFRNGLWAEPPAYSIPPTLMDMVIASGDMTLLRIEDPDPNVTSIPRGSVLGVGVSMGGGGAGDVIRLLITDPTGATFFDNSVTFNTGQRHSYWLWNRQLPTPGVWTISFLVNGALVEMKTCVVT